MTKGLRCSQNWVEGGPVDVSHVSCPCRVEDAGNIVVDRVMRELEARPLGCRCRHVLERAAVGENGVLNSPSPWSASYKHLVMTSRDDGADSLRS